jgi:GNAT superfamily N-acetyltransferase
MAWETSGDVQPFLAAAGETLRADPVRYTGLLTVADAVQLRGPNAFGDGAPLFGWWAQDGAVRAAFVHTPPHPVLLGPVPAAAVPGLPALLGERTRSGVNVPAGLEPQIGRTWGLGRPQVRRRDRLHRLATLTPPERTPPGRAVVAGPALRDEALALYTAFGEEMGEPVAGSAGLIDDRLGYGGVLLWESPAGEVLGIAARSRELAGMIRIAPVYTRPAHRGKGVAAALTAALSQAALDAGAREVLLFTDLANPTSNGVYRRIGYVAVEDRVILDLTP